MELSPPWKAQSCSATKKFSNICGTQKFITLLTRAHPFYYYPLIYMWVSTVVSFLQELIPKLSSVTCVLYALPMAPSLSDHSNNVWREVQIMKLIIMDLLQPDITLSLFKRPVIIHP
jgi:hypothetical protein